MTRPTRIPSDVNRPDRVLGPFTARQSVILAATAALLYSAWTGLRALVALPLFLAVAVPLGAVAVAVALGQRDGLPPDRFLLAALRHRLNPRGVVVNRTLHRLGKGERPGPAGLFAGARIAGVGHDPTGPGVLDLGGDGLVALAVVCTLNLGLRTPAEQDALVIGLARYLHTLTGPAQFLIRTVPLDLSPHLAALYEQARVLPHPALVAAALGHRAQLAHLATPTPTTPFGVGSGFGDELDEGFADRHALLTRQVLLVLREPHGPGGAQRLMRRLDDAAGVLSTLDVTVAPLSAAQITALLAESCSPDHPSSGNRPDVRPGPAAAPVAIVRRHRPSELDDVHLEELSLVRGPWPTGREDQPTRSPAALTMGAYASGPADSGAVDFTLADDVDDVRGDPWTENLQFRDQQDPCGHRATHLPPQPCSRISTWPVSPNAATACTP